MDFRIADTFTQSLARLAGDEQKAAKTAAFDLQLDPASPGLQLHKLDKAKDKSFWSVRVSRDIRIIIHRTEQSFLLCYVGHHDDAYRWGERRKIERHPTTGAMQIVEIRELVRDIELPRLIQSPEPAPLPAVPALSGVTEQQLLTYGIPPEWTADVLAADEDELLRLAEHLPAEAAEAVLNLATGTAPPVASPAPPSQDPFTHPDAERRFRLMTDVEELRLALEFPWDRWTIFLHPAQQATVERTYNGPARVAGSAGTGKTVVALHRAARLALQNPKARVLLTTFSIPLARNLRTKIARLTGQDPSLRARIAVRAIDEVGIEAYEAHFGRPSIPTAKMVRSLITDAAAKEPGNPFGLPLLESEWTEVVDAWQIESWEQYRDVPRLGRKTRLGEKQRAALWSIFARVRAELHARGLVTMPMVFQQLSKHLADGGTPPADFIVVDEAQDISIPQLRYLAAVAGSKENGLFFAGDLGQRIFQTPFSWASLGVDIRGRSQILKINYRTSHQIRRQADRLLNPELSDVDGVTESRTGTISAFSGPEPDIRIEESESAESRTIADWIRGLLDQGVQPHEIAIFVRSSAELPRARAAIAPLNLPAHELDDESDAPPGTVAISTMHRAKGLEFRAVVVAACDDEVIPLQSRISAVTDDSDLADVYNTERHLLYVACTRARDFLLITAADPASEFLDDLHGV